MEQAKEPMSQSHRGDLSPPDGIPLLDKAAGSRSLAEKLASLIEWARELQRSRIEDAASRKAQHGHTLQVIAAEGERAREIERGVGEQFGHLAGALITLGDAVSGTREETRRLVASVESMSRAVESLQAHSVVAAEREGLLIGELGKVHAALAGLRRQDSLTDITLSEVKGEVQKQGGALAKVGKELSLVNLARGVAIAVIAHPTSVVDLCKAAWHGLFG
jgi:hypothetical protein